MSHILNFRNWTKLYEAAGTMTALDSLQKLADEYGETLYTSEDGLTKSTARFKITSGPAYPEDPVVIANFTEPTPGQLYLKATINGTKLIEGNVTLNNANGIINIAGVPVSKDSKTDGKAVEVTKTIHAASDKYRPMSPIAGVVATVITQMAAVRAKFNEIGGFDGAKPEDVTLSSVVRAHEVDFGRSNKKYVDETTGKAVTPTQKP